MTDVHKLTVLLPFILTVFKNYTLKMSPVGNIHHVHGVHVHTACRAEIKQFKM